MKKVLIVQNNIMSYRKELYNSLASKYNIIILHSGKQSKNEKDIYNELIVPKIKVGSFIIQKRIFNEVKNGHYDVIIAMFDLHWINNILLLPFLKKTPLFYWGHRYSDNFIVDRIKILLLKKCDALILYNRSEVDRIIKSGIDNKKIFIAENTIHVENHEDCSSYSKNSFLYVGRAQKRKKVDELIRAFAQIKNKISDDITVDIVGDGDENIYLRKLAVELGVNDRVVFHGSITDNVKLKNFFRNAFAYVSPDAIGLGAQHSFAFGVPVVTISTGYKGAEFENLKHNENAILYENQNELQDVLLKLIRNPKLVEKLGMNAYQLYSTNLSIEKMAQGFIDAIEYTLK